MDFFDIFILVFRVYGYLAIFLLSLYLYKTFFVSKYKPNSDFYYRKEWYHCLKLLYALPYVNKYQQSFAERIKKESGESIEQPRKLTAFMRSDAQTIYGVDQKGNALFIQITIRESRLAELCLQLRLSDGRILQLPDHPKVLLCSIPERKWAAGGLEMLVIEPFQTLKITYNGFIRNSIRNGTEENGDVQHCFFSFIWSAASKASFFPQDMAAKELANSVAMEPWKDSNWIKLLGYQTGYEQYGSLIGQINLGPDPETIVLRLTSSRKRTWGPSNTRTLHRALTLFAADKKGNIFTLNVKSEMNGCKELHVGTMILPNRTVVPIADCDISLPDFIENGILPGALEFSFKVQGVLYDCRAFPSMYTISKFRNEEKFGYEISLAKTKYMINGEEAVGYGLFWYRHKGKDQVMPHSIVRPGIQIVEPERKFVAPLTSPECRSVYLAGLKGTSLALLNSIESDKFELLDGFCVLTPSLQYYLDKHPNIKEEIINLNDVSCGIEKGNIEEICERIKNMFTSSSLPSDVEEDIENELQMLKYQTSDVETEKNIRFCWAVRSSCVEEDLLVLPKFRNQSFLDCSNNSDVLKAVVLCWSSVYSYERVMYRRKRGLPIICEMAVVVQYAINSDVAGVLTTCHPKTADPSNMVITANFGLGVSVVTEMIEPDLANISRSWDGKLKLSHTKIGSKKSKIIITNNGIKKLENVNNKLFSLTAEQIYKISEVGLLLEKYLGGCRNIEWAIYKDRLYLLNFKIIRFPYDWGDCDLSHEGNTAIITDKDTFMQFSVENVFSGISSNLNQSVCVKYFEQSLQNIYENSDLYKSSPYRILSVYKHQVGSNIFQSLLRNSELQLTVETKINELVTTGRYFVTEKLLKESILRKNSTNMLQNVFNLSKTLKYCWRSRDFSHEAKILSRAIRIISYPEFSSFEYFNVIKRNLNLLKHVIHLYNLVTYTNIFYQKMLLNLMHDDKNDISMEEFYDIYDTYSTSSIYDIPAKMELMCALIKSKDLSSKFCKLEPPEVVLWMEKNCTEVLTIFHNIMKKFGYRAVQECDLKSETWEIHAVTFVKILQKTVQKMVDDEQNKNDHHVEKRRRTLSIREKMNGRILRWLEKRVENSFNYRETTKASLAFTINKFRFAYRELSKKLMHEGRLPERNLIFYMTQREIGELVKKKNPDLVLKAMKRAAVRPNLEKFKIPDVYTGEDILHYEISPETVPTNYSHVVGSPVMSGNIKGRAYVIHNIGEINDINAGDILITKDLDIGWCPYFPLISAIVTERGSVISQGAICVRKRSIPCIINADNATVIFKTGDLISVNGSTGLIEKIK